MLLSLLTAPALLGFASVPGGVADPVDGGCTDTSNVVMSGVTGGKTCADLAAEGRCASTDDLVKTVMAKNCMASCGACGPTRESRAYVQNGGAEGDWVLKEYTGGYATTALSEEEAKARICIQGANEGKVCKVTGTNILGPDVVQCYSDIHCKHLLTDFTRSVLPPHLRDVSYFFSSCSCSRTAAAFEPLVMDYPGLEGWICTRRDFEPGSRPAARLHALPSPPPAPRPAAGARRGARRATRSRAAARRGGWGMGREGSGDAGTAVSRRAFLKKYTCSTVPKLKP